MTKKQRLELTWIGKYEQLNLEPRILIEDSAKSYGNKSLENMLIHGDNLLALKALEKDFANKIKCVYIDPPFNTGAAFEHYDDCLENSIWLDLTYRRFELLRKLMRDDGAIFVHLDDNQAAYCKVVLDEIFGRNNYVNQIINATNKAFGFKSTSTSLFKQANHIFFYAKDKLKLELNAESLFIEKEYDTAYKYVFENTDKPEKDWTWRNINEVVANNLGYKTSRDASRELEDGFESEVALFALNNADRVFQTASVTGGAYLKRKETINKSLNLRDSIVRHPNDDMDYMFIGGRRVLYYFERLKVIDGVKLPGEIVTDIWNDIAIEGLALEGGVDFPKGKKPEKLIQRCIAMTTRKGDIVLDSFLGSGTTAAVAHKMGRKWIGIEMGDQCQTLCFPRLISVCDGTDQSGISRNENWVGGGGFKYYELAPSLLKKDAFGNWVIEEEYKPDMLASAMAKHEGFKYCPDQQVYWKQGQSTERDYIYTTTSFLTVEMLDKIHGDMKHSESLLICCKSFSKACDGKYANITVKKIPNMLLGRCEFGKKDYSLNIVSMPIDEEEEDFVPVGPDQSKVKPKGKKIDTQADLFTAKKRKK